MKHFRKNERCPCASGQKYKRCCLREGRRWYADAEGRAIPEGLAQGHADLPSVRKAIIAHLVEEEKLGELYEMPWEHIHCGSALGLLSSSARLSCMHEMGMAPELLLFVERTNFLPERHCWEHWLHTGKWPVHPASDDAFCALVAKGLQAVMAAYPYVPVRREGDDEAERGEIEFLDAVLVVRGKPGDGYGPEDAFPVAPYNEANPIPVLLEDLNQP